jgi:hypothetical protein
MTGEAVNNGVALVFKRTRLHPVVHLRAVIGCNLSTVARNRLWLFTGLRNVLCGRGFRLNAADACRRSAEACMPSGAVIVEPPTALCDFDAQVIDALSSLIAVYFGVPELVRVRESFVGCISSNHRGACQFGTRVALKVRMFDPVTLIVAGSTKRGPKSRPLPSTDPLNVLLGRRLCIRTGRAKTRQSPSPHDGPLSQLDAVTAQKDVERVPGVLTGHEIAVGEVPVI